MEPHDALSSLINRIKSGIIGYVVGWSSYLIALSLRSCLFVAGFDRICLFEAERSSLDSRHSQSRPVTKQSLSSSARGSDNVEL